MDSLFYVLEPVGSEQERNQYYAERTNRNIGWITPQEQDLLRNSVVGVAGCGGMGGLLAAILVRAGIGEVRIADSDTFDVTNINRQFGARKSSIGVSKADATAEELRSIADDMRLVVYPHGITKASAESFVRGCDVVCDEIEFWCAGSRIILHQAARVERIPLFTCTSVGFGTRLMHFTHDSAHIEDMLDISGEEALALEQNILNRSAELSDVQRVLSGTLRSIVPSPLRYTTYGSEYDDRATCVERLISAQQASIIASNPPMAAGFLANHVLLQLLVKGGVERSVQAPPRTPGYLFFDAAMHEVRRIEGGDFREY